MSKKFSFKKSQPSTNDVGKSQENIVFGFSELRAYSYVDSHNDSDFFISFLGQIEETEFYRSENSKYFGSSFFWNGKNESR